MDNLNTDKLSFTELAILAMSMVNRPVTPSQLWEFVVQNKLQYRLNTFDDNTGCFSGKTPNITFMRIIYTDKKHFQEMPNTKPKQYILKNQNNDELNQEVQEIVKLENSKKFNQKSYFHERDLHQVLSYFLRHDDYFMAYSKTIFHETSQKGIKGEDRWLYPDMVAVSFEYANYQKSCVLNFINKFDQLPIKVFSFEIKKELNFSNYKESFFQAVSNSSWANEGYLVAVNIKPDSQFIEALQKLSISFGIGIIELNLIDIHQSKIVSPAKFKENMDYSVISELANKSPNFAGFLKTMTDFDVNNPNRYKDEFDEILTDGQLAQCLSKLTKFK
ncbi:hypothetical protein LU293_01180 [Moraxella nasovis]|uniref:hypothetical protein n=1 Tax=Moraxella nasovis TaxID=2904121 RepID=UPI001F606327|nr:hypothetical protein [Moraxella nasovis]UNU73555.1 hypothetical protein LU293_01180 [Moraxella nasovis]